MSRSRIPALSLWASLLAAALLAVASTACDSLPTTADAGVEEDEPSTGPYIPPGPPYDMAAIWQMVLDGRQVRIPVELELPPYHERVPGDIERAPGGGWRTVGLEPVEEPLAPRETRFFPDGSLQYQEAEEESRVWGCVEDAVSGVRWATRESASNRGSRASRHWSRESIRAAPRSVPAEVPTFVLVPEVTGEAVRARTGATGRQRVVTEAEFLGDGRVVLLYGVARDSVLLHFLDPASGDQLEVPAPKGAGGESPEWAGASMVTGDQGIVVGSGNWSTGRGADTKFGRGQWIWHADRRGRFVRVPSWVGSGRMLGVYPDGAVVLWQSALTTTAEVSRAEVWCPVAGGNAEFGAPRPRVLFSTEVPRDTGGGGRVRGTHEARQTAAIVGETIWIVPTERPELMALDRAGGVTLKVEWEAGDRGLPAGAGDAWSGVERFPAAADLIVGADGLIYVQRWTLVDGRPARGPEWLAFSPSGELVRRLDIPSHLWVLAIADGSVVVRARNREGLDAICVHALEPSQPASRSNAHT